MKYLLKIFVLGTTPEVVIGEGDYASLKNSRKILENAFAIEEKYGILISNYIDFEKQLLESINLSMIRDIEGYSDFFNTTHLMNIRVVNLLTASKLYLDQLQKHVRACATHLDNSNAIVKSLTATEYDKNPNYRFMEALRNHVQHSGLPIHNVSMGSRWTSFDDDRFLEFSISISSIKSILENDSTFKKATLNELADKVDIKIATRSYIESLSKIHEAVRTIINEPVEQARREIENAHGEYKKVYSLPTVALSACIKDDGQYFARVSLLLDWDDIRKELKKKNGQLINLSKRYSTSK